MSTGPSVSTAASSEDEKKEHRLVDVMFLCDEWKSSKGGLSTFNREFAINLAETTTGSMKIHCYVSKSDDRDREDAKQHGVNLVTARSVPGSSDPFECLKFPPSELPNPQLVIGHGRKLGSPAYSLMQYTKCKWIQFVHVYCEDLGKYKKTTAVATDTIEENEKKHKMEIDLCKVADAVVAVGSRLQQKYSRSLPNVKVEIITPGIFEKFSSESQFAIHRSDVKNFNVFLFGRATFEDLSLKGYDIVANAIGSLGKRFELKFVGSSPGEHQKVEQWFLDNTRINRNQLTIRGYCSDPEELRTMFYQSDLVALPSRTDGFGLVALEAVSAGIPILVSGESGIAEALREVKGGKTVIVELDEDTDEWARRISKMAKKSAEEREAKARRLRKNYRKVYSWRVECEKFKGMIAKVMENANDDEIDVGVEVEDLKPAKSKNQTTTSSMESAECQMDELLKSSAESTMVGSVSHPGTESLPEIREKFFYLVGKRYLQTMKPQSKKEYDEFIDYLQKLGAIMTRVRRGSLVITVKCESLQILEDLWKDYSSGHLGEVVQNCFVTEKILKELNLAELRLKTTIDTEDYNACKVYFEKVAHREQEELLDLKLQRMKGIPPLTAIPTTGHEEELEEPTEKIGNWEEPEDPPVKFRRMEGFSPFHEMSTIGQEKGGEELEETLKATWPLLGPSTSDLKEELEELRLKPQGMEDQKLNIKVDVEHVKLADHDTCSTASVSTMEPAECQKVSIASGARRKRPSDTDLEDVQPLEKKVLCLIAMNYLHTTPPESRDECNEFQEYLLDMKVHITCVSVGSLVITVKCNSLKSLEELWEDYSCGLLGKMVRDCFVTEKILKELNLAELKLKTTMDIEEYNACKLYFEKNAPRGALSSEFHPISSTSKSSQKQEELKKWKQKTKIEKTEKMKGTPPLTVISTTGKRKELDESTGKTVTSPSAVYFTTGHEKEKILRHETMKLQEKKGTSLSTKLSTVGHGKELEGKLKTMKLQEEKSILPLFEEEPEGLLMKLQRRKGSSPSVVLPPAGQKKELEERQKTMKIQGEKGSLPSPPLPTTDLEEKLEEVCVELMRLRKEGTLVVPESSTSYLVKKLAELRMELIRVRMEGTLPPPELFTAKLEKELKVLHAKLPRQSWEDSRLLISTFNRDVKELLRKLQEKRMEALENTMYPIIRSGLAKFDVSLPEELQSYVSYLFNESAKLGLRKRALHSLNAVEELQEAVDEYELKTFLSIHIREGAWQVALLFMDELSYNKLPWDWFFDAWYRWEEEEEIIGLSLYSSTSGILKAWPTEYDPDLVTLCKAITDRDWKVTGLILSCSRISEEGLKNLCTALTQGELYCLTLYRNGLQSQRLEHLCEVLISRDCNLTSLNVSGNWLGDEGIMCLCNVLTSVDCKLTSLNVSDSRLGDEEIMQLFTVLTSSNCTLTRLNVSLNRAGDRAVKDFARALTNKNCALTSLDISCNQIRDEGIKYLCKASTDPNCKLRSLDLRWNGKVTDAGKQCLSEAITGTDWEVRGGLTLSRSIKSEA
ncbi:uncharacterized protein LOC111341950 isoform X1 [Stylophora pistillata]|uniref:uncharacterized protein LOC111341950 isoform X1 n=1 Tax=Stylophora pistillata TaxID=50429 RepID=UPI000C0423C2|nr:uncharacterized protein LOC111341950 isoform X1 [Stylophora pistillata]